MNKLKILLIGVLVVGAFLLAKQAFAFGQHTQVTICHATGSQNNPYVKLTVDDDAVDGFGNSDHNRSGHQNGEDIIPPGFWDFNGRNWNSEGQAIYRNDCEVPEEPKDVCENLDGVQEETPEGYINNEGYCYIPDEPKDYCDTLEGVQSEQDECPKEEQPPVCTVNCGTPPTFQGSTTEAPVCPNGSTTNVVANPHVLRNGTEATVNFFITEGDSANIYYSVVGQPHWGNAVANVKPNSDNFVSYTIHDLDANLGYDFGIQQVKGCGGGKTTAVVVDGPSPRLFNFSYWE